MPEPIANTEVLQHLRRMESSIDADKQWYRKKFQVHTEAIKELQAKVVALEAKLLEERIATHATPKRVRVP